MVSNIKILILPIIIFFTYITVNGISDIYSNINCEKVNVGVNNFLCINTYEKKILQILNFNNGFTNKNIKIGDFLGEEGNFTEVNYFNNGLGENENINFLSFFTEGKERDTIKKGISIASENNFFILKFLSVRFASDKNYDYFKNKIIENRNNGIYLFNYQSLLENNNEKQKYNDILLFLKYQNIKSNGFNILKEKIKELNNIIVKEPILNKKENNNLTIKKFDNFFKNKEVVNLLNKGLIYNNPDIIGIRWSKPFNDNYETISKNLYNYSQDGDIAFFMICFFHGEEKCERYSKGIQKIEENILIYINSLKPIKEKQTLNKKTTTGKLWVTSYNPECRQTKGGTKGKDGLCRANKNSPCAVGSNRGKISGLCGNPCIGATGVNLCTLIKEGGRPIAVGQDMLHLRNKKVTATCYKKGVHFDDPRCNGEFIVLDHKHERFSKTVDIFFMDRKDNIGQVDMVLTEVKTTF